MRPAYPRGEMQQRICAAVEGGARLRELAGRPGWPSRQTVHRWASEEEGFARRLDEALGWRRGVLVEARAGSGFDEGVAQAFLLRVRRGEAVRRLVRTEGLPDRALLDRWKRERPDFAAELVAAARFSREVRDKAWARFDEAAGDRIVARVASGRPLPEVLGDADVPGRAAVRRWRAREPGFDWALKVACRAGHRVRMAGRVRLTEAVAETILDRLVAGWSLRQACQGPGMPHYVTVMAWQRRDVAFARMVAWGRDVGRDARLGGDKI